MKARILPSIGLIFAILVVSRAVAFSSEPLAVDLKNPSLPETSKQIQEPKECLTGVILETITLDIARLETRKKDIARREAALEAIEKKLETQMTAIETANATLQTNIQSMTSIANEDIVHLVGMYQTMKPKQAAAIFNSMDPAFAAGFLRRINSGKAGLIMANMETRKSYAVSLVIANENTKYRRASP